MTGIVYQRLVAKITRPDSSSEKSIDYKFFEKVTNEIKYMIGTALNSDDISALKVIASAISPDLYRFFSDTSDTYKHVNEATKQLVKALSQHHLKYTNTRKKPQLKLVSCEQFSAMAQSFAPLRNRKDIYTYCASEKGINTLHDMLIDPNIIEPSDQALILLCGNKPAENSNHFKLSDLDESVRTNPVIRLFSRVLSRFSIRPSLLSKDEKAKEHTQLPEHHLGIQYGAYSYEVALSKYKPDIHYEELSKDALHIDDFYSLSMPDRELRSKMLTQSNSLLESIKTYLRDTTMLSVEVELEKDGSIVYGRRRSISGVKNFLTVLNEDAYQTRVALRHIDKLCDFLHEKLSEEKASRALPVVIDHLKKLFQRANHHYMPNYLIMSPLDKDGHMIALFCIDLPLPGISKLFCEHLKRLEIETLNSGTLYSKQDDPVRKFIYWMGRHLPDASAHYIVDHDLLPAKHLESLLDNGFNSLTYFVPNPEYKIKYLAQLMSTVEHHHPKLLAGTTLASFIEETAKVAEKASHLEGLFDAEFMRGYYKDFSRHHTDPQPEHAADMGFLAPKRV